MRGIFEMIPKFFAQEAVTAAVLIHGRMREAEEPQEPNQRLVMPWTEWVWKLILIAVIYVAYFLWAGLF